METNEGNIVRKIVGKNLTYTGSATSSAIDELLAGIQSGNLITRVNSPGGPVEALILSIIFSTLQRSLIVVTATEQEAGSLRKDIAFFTGNEDLVRIFPAYDPMPADLFAIQRDTELARIDTLCRLFSRHACIVTASIASLLTRTIPRKSLSDYLQTVSIGDNIERDMFLDKLLSGGYRKTALVEEKGEFSIRGHIIDVYPVTSDKPLRMEFFGDELESIRPFDPISQRSVGEIVDFSLPPAREVIITEKSRMLAIHNIKERFNELDLAKSLKSRILESLENSGSSSVNPIFLSLFYENGNRLAECSTEETGDSVRWKYPGSLADFISEEGIVVYDNPMNIRQSLQSIESGMERFLEKAASADKFYLDKKSSFLSHDLVFDQFSSFRQILFEELSVNADESGVESAIELKAERVDRLIKTQHNPSDESGLLTPLIEGITKWTSEGNLVTLVCSGQGEMQRIHNLLDRYSLTIAPADMPFLDLINRKEKKGQLILLDGKLSGSFIIPELQLVAITEDDVFGKKTGRRKVRTSREGYFLKSFGELKEGDYVVHTDHGIGLYRGLQKLTAGGIENDFLLLEYQDNDRLYLPVDRLDILQRYIGPDGYQPRIDRLGGTSWDAVKEKVKKSVREVAEELVSIYAAREVMERDAFAPPDRTYEEFCSSFAFEETPDQAKAIDDIQLDMSDSKPMDRLVCGDAGFGKTEVALRASFRAVMDGKQVALLVPTTILAEQHYQTFMGRLHDYPMRVAVMNRLKSKAQQQNIADEISKGSIDIIIGTHRILQKDVCFKNLGLVIIDEEQRFGVAHKEKLKKLRTLVDVLTLSATPIPRTLHLSLVGIRDLSIINTPPEDRLPVKTFLFEFDEDLISGAIRRELARDGQVFFVHDRIHSIYSMTRLLGKLIPEARIGIVHGRMKPKEIEDTMVKFVKKDYNILVCTTIVASGVDIPTANTIVINRADRFGLAQLYQIRGRVGRSREEAFAYLLVPKGAMLTRDAQKRLQVIMDFSEPGSGFRIASNDLEIRGAGSLLGISQSGHVSAVGYELYTELMEKTIQELKGVAPKEEDFRPEIQLGLSAYIPEDYMEDDNRRLVTYKKISMASSDDEIEEIRAGLKDGFGFLPEEINNLLETIRIRNILKLIRGKKMFYDGKNMSIMFRTDSPIDPARLIALSRRQLKGMRLTPDMTLSVPAPGLAGNDIWAKVDELLKALSG
jgi:transcription-repair coupling factor (superfamily II helicase)